MTSHESATKSLDARVEDMLLDAGAAGDVELRAALLSLGSLAVLPAPAPSGDLAKLFAAAKSSSRPATDAPGDELARRRRRRTIHRPTLLGIALIAGMGTGIGGVAASSPAPGQVSSLSVQELLADWSPSWSLTAQPLATAMSTPAETEAGEVTGQPVPAAEPGPLAPSAPLPVPPAHDAAGQLPLPQAAAAGRPGAAPDLPAQATQSNGGGARGQEAPEARGRAADDLPDIAGSGAGEPGPGLPAGVAGNATAEESGVAENLVRPLAEAARPVVGAATGNPAPLENWLRKFQR